ncbi:MAG: sigma-70 family RNA polymerase sigma factor [bacterium]|nr:sigma-70 family RNA polymerase sigma factor [bacterium]
MANDGDKILIEKYFQGDEKSLEILIQNYLKPVYSFVYRYIGNAGDAEDITQEAFVKAWRHLKRFDRNKSFKTWIFSIAKNTSLDFLKKSRSALGGKKTIPFSELENEERENTFAETLIDPSPLPQEILERQDVSQVLNRLMEKLSPNYRMVLFLRYNDHFTPLEVHSAAGGMAPAISGLPLTGFTFREIAESLGEPLNTVKSRHRRALIILKKLLDK